MISIATRFSFLLLAVAAMTASADAAITALSVNFQFDPVHVIPTDASNTAGVVPARFWNNLDAGGLSSAVLSDGSTSGIGVSMNAAAEHVQIPTPGNHDERLMVGSFDLHGGTLTLSVTGLPDELTSAGYDIYVYSWGNDTANQQGRYEAVLEFEQGNPVTAFFDQTIEDFNGFDNSGQSSTDGDQGPANYIKFERVGKGQDNFVVEITNVQGLTPDAWTIINGFQVVAVPEPGMSAVSFSSGILILNRRRQT